MYKSEKKQIITNYKSKQTVGGVYKITNKVTGKILLESARKIHGIQSRFEFAKTMDSYPSMKIQQDWSKYGSDAFEFEILDELEQKETQTTREFYDDIDALKDIWLDKFIDKERY